MCKSLSHTSIFNVNIKCNTGASRLQNLKILPEYSPTFSYPISIKMKCLVNGTKRCWWLDAWPTHCILPSASANPHEKASIWRSHFPGSAYLIAVVLLLLMLMLYLLLLLFFFFFFNYPPILKRSLIGGRTFPGGAYLIVTSIGNIRHNY